MKVNELVTLLTTAAESPDPAQAVQDAMARLKGDLADLAETLSYLPADRAHVAECLSDESAIGLHVYGANVLGVERSMWDPENMEEQRLDWRQYEPLAQKPPP